MIACVCGCGKSVGVRRLRANRLLSRHDRALDAARTLLGGELEHEIQSTSSENDTAIDSNRTFVERGETLRDMLLEHLHRTGSTRVARRELVRWQRSAFRIARQPKR